MLEWNLGQAGFLLILHARPGPVMCTPVPAASAISLPR